VPITPEDIRQAGEPDRETLRRRAAHAGPIDEDRLVSNRVSRGGSRRLKRGRSDRSSVAAPDDRIGVSSASDLATASATKRRPA
jgi:hypothetical protein